MQFRKRYYDEWTNGPYDLRDQYIGQWVNDKKEWPFQRIYAGMTYDTAFQNDLEIPPARWFQMTQKLSEHTIFL